MSSDERAGALSRSSSNFTDGPDRRFVSNERGPFLRRLGQKPSDPIQKELVQGGNLQQQLASRNAGSML